MGFFPYPNAIESLHFVESKWAANLREVHWSTCLAPLFAPGFKEWQIFYRLDRFAHLNSRTHRRSMLPCASRRLMSSRLSCELGCEAVHLSIDSLPSPGPPRFISFQLFPSQAIFRFEVDPDEIASEYSPLHIGKSKMHVYSSSTWERRALISTLNSESRWCTKLAPMTFGKQKIFTQTPAISFYFTLFGLSCSQQISCFADCFELV